MQSQPGKQGICILVSREELEEKATYLSILYQHFLLRLLSYLEPGMCRLAQLHLP